MRTSLRPAQCILNEKLSYESTNFPVTLAANRGKNEVGPNYNISLTSQNSPFSKKSVPKSIEKIGN